MPVVPYKSFHPQVAESVFLAPDAWITGAVEVEEDVSILFGAVLRGDVQKIFVGRGSNVQDHSILHTQTGKQDCIVGRNVTIGHRATLHSCTIKDCCLIGMGSVLLDCVEIGEYSIVGAHALVTMNTKVPPRSLVLGSPARVVREVRPEEIAEIESSAKRYREVGAEYRRVFGAN